ncbi:DUF2809 domain-containing protein [Haliscomenobacter sp.]|uniref:ribosomal maturation YjgA family protein n=1 Tax=Haliscomenobacter sp. TaxID=2717303 RepID=UPI003BAAAC62
MKFNPRYFVYTILLFVTEVLIALFVHDQFIRPYIGDFLVVILIYCFVKSFLNTPVVPTALGVLVFAYTVELLQYFRIVEVLGLQHSRAARIIIGSSFEWQDILAYTLGILMVILIEKRNTLFKKSRL